MHNHQPSIGDMHMPTIETKQSRWIDPDAVHKEYASKISLIEIFGTIVFMSVLVGLVAPILI